MYALTCVHCTHANNESESTLVFFPMARCSHSLNAVSGERQRFGMHTKCIARPSNAYHIDIESNELHSKYIEKEKWMANAKKKRLPLCEKLGLWDSKRFEWTSHLTH